MRFVPLTIYTDSSEKLTTVMRIHPKADVTVMMWRGTLVKANLVCRSDQLSEQFLERVSRQAEGMVQPPKP